MTDKERELLSAAKEAVEVLEDLIAEADIYATYLRLKEAIEGLTNKSRFSSQCGRIFDD